MQREKITAQLNDLSKRIADAEGEAVKSAEALAEAEEALLVAEDLLLTEGKLDGKNQETRDAQARQMTAELRQKRADARRAHAKNAGRLRVLLCHFSACRNVAKLYAREEEPRG